MKRIALLTAGVAALVATGVANAGFGGNPCSLVSTRQLSLVHVAPQKCTVAHTTTQMGSAVTAMWGALGKTPTSLEIIVAHPDTSAALSFAEQQIRRGKKLPILPIGEWGQGTTENGGTGATVYFVKHGYLVAVLEHTTRRTFVSLQPAITFAQKIAAKF